MVIAAYNAPDAYAAAPARRPVPAGQYPCQHEPGHERAAAARWGVLMVAVPGPVRMSRFPLAS